MRLKQWLFYWAHLDIEHTYDQNQTYFVKFREEIKQKNLVMIRFLSAFLAILGVCMVILTSTVINVPGLRNLYVVLFLLELVFYALSAAFLRHSAPSRTCDLLCVLFPLHLLGFGAYIGTVLSPDENASIFLVTLMISQIIFILPPVLSVGLTAFATAGALIGSYLIKPGHLFQTDLLNCVGVLFLATLLGWLVNKLRAEEAFARSRVQTLNEQLLRLSVTDQLTGLPNHRSFQDTYYALFKASQAQGSRIGVIILDIDQFKSYNDNYGHIAGDKCLSAIGEAFRTGECGTYFVCRFGGEEFLVLLEDADCDRAEAIATKFLHTVEALAIPHAFSHTAQVITVSAGLHVGCPAPGDQPTGFIDKADRAMYLSKANGGNRLTDFQDLSAIVHAPAQTGRADATKYGCAVPVVQSRPGSHASLAPNPAGAAASEE